MSVWEPCDDFEGPWKLVKLTGCESLGATSQFYFWGHDGMGQLDFAAVAGFLECKYGETPEGLPAVTFKLDGLDGEKPIRGSGLGAIQRDGKTLQGSLKIGRRASAFVAQRET